MTQAPFLISLAVRDYECDLQGVVNNAVYQQYLEHARHEFLKAHDIDFAALSRAGIHLVVVRAVLDYRRSATSGDMLEVVTRMERPSRLRFAFVQTITHSSTRQTVLDAHITATALNPKGRPYLPDELLTLVG